MRDTDALLNSPINIDRNSLVAVLSAEARAAKHLASLARQRTASQRAKWQEARRPATRVDWILAFSEHGDVSPDMSEGDIALCKSVEQKLRAPR